MCRIRKLIMRGLLTILLAMAMAIPSLAKTEPEFKQIKGEDLRAVYLNTLVLSEYRTFKGINNKTYDHTEFHHADGTTDYTEIGSKTEKGEWKIIGDDKICYRYPTTEAFPKTYCFFVYRQDKCYYQYSLGAMTIHGPRSWDLWVSRFVRKGDGGVCGEPVS